MAASASVLSRMPSPEWSRSVIRADTSMSSRMRPMPAVGNTMWSSAESRVEPVARSTRVARHLGPRVGQLTQRPEGSGEVLADSRARGGGPECARASVRGAFGSALLLPNGHSVTRVQPQRVALGHREGAIELVDVAHDLVAAELVRGVRVDGEQPDDLLVAGLVLPGLRPGQEEPLGAGQCRRSPGGSSPSSESRYAFQAMPRPPRSPMFSPIVSAPLTWWSGTCRGASALYCSISDAVQLLERRAVRRRSTSR